jgi:hypothetical protein
MSLKATKQATQPNTAAAAARFTLIFFQKFHAFLTYGGHLLETVNELYL